jgi:hypothetical protein
MLSLTGEGNAGAAAAISCGIGDPPSDITDLLGLVSEGSFNTGTTRGGIVAILGTLKGRRVGGATLDVGDV